MPDSLIAWFGFAFAVTLGAVASPGPVSTTIVSQSPRGGWIIGPLITTGHVVLEIALTLGIIFGLSAALVSPAVQTGIALIGGPLLIWMGGGMLLDMLRDKIHLPRGEEMVRSMSRWQVFGLGMLTTISNPFWYAWWVTVAARYLTQASEVGLTSVAAFFLGHISADYGWNTALSSIVGGGKRWFSDGVYRALIGLCALFLVYVGITFLLQGIGLL